MFVEFYQIHFSVFIDVIFLNFVCMMGYVDKIPEYVDM